MNAKQSLRVVAKRLEEVETVLSTAQADIAAYNKVIGAMILGGSACPWCEEYKECLKEGKAEGRTGCGDWWLTYDIHQLEEEDNATEDSERITLRGATNGFSGGSSGVSAGSAEVPESPVPGQPDASQ